MKTPVLESLFNKVADLQLCNFIKKRLRQSFFSVKFAKFLRALFYRTLRYPFCKNSINALLNTQKPLLIAAVKNLVLINSLNHACETIHFLQNLPPETFTKYVLNLQE